MAMIYKFPDGWIEVEDKDHPNDLNALVEDARRRSSSPWHAGPGIEIDPRLHTNPTYEEQKWLNLAMRDYNRNPELYENDNSERGIMDEYRNSKNALGISKINNPFSKGNIAYTAVAAAPVVGGLGNKLLSNGLSSKAGTAVSTIGTGVGGALAMIPGAQLLGAGVIAGSGIVGGGLNRLFGSKLNDNNIANVKFNNNMMRTTASALGKSESTDALINNWNNTSHGFAFDKKYIGRDGPFGNKAKKTYNRLLAQQNQANAYALGNLELGAKNVDKIQDANVMRNFAAYGGPLAQLTNNNNMGPIEYGFMQDYLTTKDRQAQAREKLSGMASLPSINTFAEGGQMVYPAQAAIPEGPPSEEAMLAARPMLKLPIKGRQQYSKADYANAGIYIDKRGNPYRHDAKGNKVYLSKKNAEAMIEKAKERQAAEVAKREAANRMGKAFVKSLASMVPQQNTAPTGMQAPVGVYALGGTVQMHGGDFPRSLMEINAGGSHEENPYQGVQIGTDSEGTPNLLEEGETVARDMDYAFSTRIMADGGTLSRFHLNKKRKISFADLSKKLSKEAEERPNDPISKAAVKNMLASLAEEQERQKTKMSAQRAEKAFRSLSPEAQVAMMEQLSGPGQGMMQGMEESYPEQYEEAPSEELYRPETMMQSPMGISNMSAYGGPVNIMADGGFKKWWDEATKKMNKGNTYNWHLLFRYFFPSSDALPIQSDHYNEKNDNYNLEGAVYTALEKLYNSNPQRFENFDYERDIKNSPLGESYQDGKIKFISGPEGYDDYIKANPYNYTYTTPEDNDKLLKGIYNGLAGQRIFGPDAFNRWADENGVTGYDLNNARALLNNESFRSAVARYNPSLAHVMEAGYDYGLRGADNNGLVVNLNTAGRWNGGKKPNWYKIWDEGEQDEAWKEAKEKGLVKEGMSRDDIGKALMQTDAWKQTTELLKNDPEMRRRYFEAIVRGNDSISKEAKDYALQFVDSNGKWLDKYKDKIPTYDDSLKKVRETNAGNYWKTIRPEYRNRIEKNFYLNDNGVWEEMLAAVPEGWKPKNSYTWNSEKGSNIYNYYEDPDKVAVAAAAADEEIPDSPTGKEVYPVLKNEAIRYAGLLGPVLGLGLMTAGVGKPDTSALMAAAEGANTGAGLASYQPIGNYLRYNPMDVERAQNRMDANARATDRALVNAYAPLGMRQASLISSGYGQQMGTGEMRKNALEYNDAKDAQVQGFNNGVDQFNADAFNKTSMANADFLSRNKQFAANLLAQATQAKLQADAGWYGSLYGNINNIFKGISDVGRENAQHNMIARMAADGIFGNMSGKTYTGQGYITEDKNNSGAEGGKINRKRRRKGGLTI